MTVGSIYVLIVFVALAMLIYAVRVGGDVRRTFEIDRSERGRGPARLAAGITEAPSGGLRR